MMFHTLEYLITVNLLGTMFKLSRIFKLRLNSFSPYNSQLVTELGQKTPGHWDMVKVRIYESAIAAIDALGVLFAAFELENDAISTIAKK